LRAFPELPRTLSEEELRKFLTERRGKWDQKRALHDLFSEYGLGRFTANRGAQIAAAMAETPQDVVQILAVIGKEIGHTGDADNSAGGNPDAREQNLSAKR
jgi:hypothetical protein